MADDKRMVFKVEVDDRGAITKLKSTTKGIKDIDLTSKNAKQAVDRLTASISKVGSGGAVKNVKLTTKELQKLKNEVGGLSDKSGAAAATTLELGRVISDAPYGIRGMANNVSQVASQMAFMSNSVDAATGKTLGFMGAVKLVKAQIMGPLGILLAFQAVIAALDFFLGGMKKSEDGAADLNLQIEKLNKNLAIQKELIEGDGETSQLLTDYFEAIEGHIENLEKTNELSNLEAETKERIGEINETLIKNEEKKAEALRDVKSESDGIADSATIREQAEKRIVRLDEYADELKKERVGLFDKLLRKQNEVTDAQNKWKEGTKTTADELKAVISILTKKRDAISTTNKEYDKATKEINIYTDALKKLKGELTDVEKLQKKLNKTFADDKAEAIAAITEAESDYLDSLLPEYDQEVLAINEKYFKLKEAAVQYGQDTVLLEKARLKEIADIDLGDDDQDREKFKRIGVLTAEEIEEARVKQAEQIDDLFQSKFQLEEKNAQHFIDLNKRVGESIANNEKINQAKRAKTAKLGAEERLKTQLLYLDAVGAGLQAMSQIAGSETNAGKAIAVAGATIDTYAAITAQLAASTKGDPKAAIPGYAIAQAVATGLFGLANVKKIIETSVPGGGGGVGGGGSIPSAGRTFDFNLAGSTGQNQLAQTIGGQVAQPIKAYVVSSEITNQQQFDNQIQGEVTIG